MLFNLKLCILFFLFSSNEKPFFGKISKISKEIKIEMQKYTWREGCPVAIADLSYLSFSHFDDKGQICIGDMIVHNKVAKEVIDIFRELFSYKFPIKSVKIISDYGGDDVLSMNADNSSAFNCREITGQKGVFSNHSYGIAIDLNPIENPYVKDEVVLPSSGKSFLDRKNEKKGMILKGGKVYEAFIKRGWIWGGDWNSLKDYQHFEKKLED